MTDNEDLIEIIPEELQKEREELRNHFIENTNIENSPEEMKVLDDMIIRLQQLGFTLKTRGERDKYKRAFEILKDTVYKSFDFNIFCREVKKGDSFEKTYFIIFGEVWIKITKEEYELLEELMKDGKGENRKNERYDRRRIKQRVQS